MLSLSPIQEYLRFKASQHHGIIASPPFTFYLHITDFGKEANYAIPDTSGSADLPESLTRLQSIFKERQRTPRLEFIEDVFPDLSPMLLSAGWSKVESSPVMTCTPETYRPGSAVLGLTISPLSYESSTEEICEGLTTNARGFDPQAEPATPEEAEAFRRDLILNTAFTAHLAEQPVAAGMFTGIQEGLTELVGITTLEPFRRRGIAAALTAHMTQQAFEQGAQLVFLIAANEQAGHVYESVGFRTCATHVVYEIMGEI